MTQGKNPLDLNLAWTDTKDHVPIQDPALVPEKVASNVAGRCLLT